MVDYRDPSERPTGTRRRQRELPVCAGIINTRLYILFILKLISYNSWY